MMIASAPQVDQTAAHQPGLRSEMTLEQALQTVRADEARRVEVLARAARSVVCIFADRTRGGGGSGVIIDPRGYGLTNYHVVQSFLETRQGYGGLSDGKLYPLRVLGVDAGGDIAMFQITGRSEFDAAPLGDSDRLRVGQWVAAMGNPFLVAEDFFPTITYGVISGLNRYQQGQQNFLEYADCIQVSTSINPGNSGGPLFDLGGNVIGINGRASFEHRGRVNVGLGYAVSVNQIKRFLPGLRAGQFVEHGRLGATVREINGKLIVDAIETLSAAEKVGLELGDELLAVAGRALRTPNDYNNVIAILPRGWPVEVVFRRDEDTQSVNTRLDRLPLPSPTKYLVDWDHNHTELRAMFARLRAQWWSSTPPEGAVLWIGELAGHDGAVAPLRIASHDAKATESQPTAELPADWVDQWRRLMLPLCQDPQTDETWEWVGGDEFDGRIAAVIEQRLDGDDRVRWLLDFETAELMAVNFVDSQGETAARWQPKCPGDFHGHRLPAVWSRTSGGLAQTITITDVQIVETPTGTTASETQE
jgi:S1-C subfamily serine protease